MFRWLNLLVLFCVIKYRGSPPAPVTGERGGSVTLPCGFEDRNITHIDLNSLSENILACPNEKCGCKNGRVCKEGKCDIILNNLRLSDAGRYFLKVYYTNDQTEVEREILEYHLHIQDEISVKKGEQLKLDVLMINADKVQHQNRRSTEWTEVWTRGHGVRRDRLNISDETLTVNAFTSTDTGTYRVLDSEGEILITVTVTESVEKSTGRNKSFLIGLSVFGIVALVLAVIIYFVFPGLFSLIFRTVRACVCECVCE